MSRTAHTVTLAVNVHDPAALWAAAMAHAMKESMTQDDAAELLGTQRRPDVPACLQMLLDPGTGPAGTSIEACDCDSGISLD